MSLLLRVMPALAGIVLCASIALPAPATHAADLDRAVLAYYYTWFDTDSFGRGQFQPVEPYNSDDTAVMARHIGQAQTAGIDGFIVDWLGDANRTDVNFAHLLDLVERRNFSATIHFDTPTFWGAEDVEAQLRAFVDHYRDRPGLVRYQGRPVVFFWRASTYSNATWSAIRSRIDPERRMVWLADGDSFGILNSDVWDGISPYTIAWSANPASQLPRWADAARRAAPETLWTPPVSPGCDDSGVRATTCLQGRADGGYYQASWDGALASNPSWAVVVTTFNEWLEATQIEPSPAYGDQYLQLTRQNADAFKASGAAPAAAAAATAVDPLPPSPPRPLQGEGGA